MNYQNAEKSGKYKLMSYNFICMIFFILPAAYSDV